MNERMERLQLLGNEWVYVDLYQGCFKGNKLRDLSVRASKITVRQLLSDIKSPTGQCLHHFVVSIFCEDYDSSVQ